MRIGSHVSISGGLLGAAKEAVSYGANAFMIYTGAPQTTRRSPIEALKIDEGIEYMAQHGISIDDVVVHAPYLINLASYKESTYELGINFLKSEIERTERIGSKYLVLHPGAFTEKDVDYGIQRIADGLNQILTPETNLQIALETMAGKGTEIGRSFEELAAIIEKTELKQKLCVCFDTCHTHDSGYNVVDDFDTVLEQFDKIIGLDLLKVYHINGSLNVRGAKKDRHANIGADETNPKGKDNIGFEAIRNVVHHPKNKDKIFILETPWIDDKTNLYKQEIEMLR